MYISSETGKVSHMNVWAHGGLYGILFLIQFCTYSGSRKYELHSMCITFCVIHVYPALDHIEYI